MAKAKAGTQAQIQRGGGHNPLESLVEPFARIRARNVKYMDRIDKLRIRLRECGYSDAEMEKFEKKVVKLDKCSSGRIGLFKDVALYHAANSDVCKKRAKLYGNTFFEYGRKFERAERDEIMLIHQCAFAVLPMKDIIDAEFEMFISEYRGILKGLKNNLIIIK